MIRQWVSEHIISSKYVCDSAMDNHFSVGVKSYRFGLAYNNECFRVMLIWWHVCFLENIYHD
jgi:hypothetical protein